MLKRLIEVALPLKEISLESAYDNRVRSGHIRTLHIWWARRPLVACRAVIFASLIPDPDNSECPQEFCRLVMSLLNHERYRPSGERNGQPTEDTPRNRCLEFIKYLVKWENSNNPVFIDPARKLIAAAHKVLHPGSEGEAPKVLDPFAGGGAIPLEALRLGCESHAVDLNPVAHLIELCTLVYPQKYGQPDSRQVPSYIKTLIALNRGRKAKTSSPKGAVTQQSFTDEPLHDDEGVVPNVDISEEQYLKNPLASDVQYWGYLASRLFAQRVEQYYQNGSERLPLAFLWARTVTCSNPQCRATVPLIRSLWLCNKPTRKKALKATFNLSMKTATFSIVENQSIDFDPSKGTIRDGELLCPFCATASDGSYLRSESISGRMGHRLTAVVVPAGSRSKSYRLAMDADVERSNAALLQYGRLAEQLPHEPIPTDRPSPNSRGLSAITRYGVMHFGDMFNPRQATALFTLTEIVQEIRQTLNEHFDEPGYADAVATYIAFAVDKVADFSSTFCRWGNDDEGVTGTFGMQAVPMVWDYAETNPLSKKTGGFEWALKLVVDSLSFCSESSQHPACVGNGSATRLQFNDSSVEAIIVDPPYYDSVPYGDLSDFFYVWLKRSVGSLYSELFRTPLTPKREEAIAYWGSGTRAVNKTPQWYEHQIGLAFSECRRTLKSSGTISMMFAHKTTTAWESIINALQQAGLYCTASWPIHTEGRGRLTSHDAAALASSITMVCRKRLDNAGVGLWDDVRRDLQKTARERLDFFWSQGIRGADFFISAIGPALSVFGKYEQVTKLDGEPVTVGHFLDEVRGIVTNYALAKILKTTHTGNIDPESRFYVVWKWSYGDSKLPAGEAFVMAQALGIDTELMWDRTGVLEKDGENAMAVPIITRMKIKDLGDPNANGSPASLIDVLHRLCVFREKNDIEGMTEFLARSGQGSNHSLWLVAQAISEILPDGDKEKQLMQGLLNQKDQLAQAQGRMF